MCIGCHACTVACKTEHAVPLGVNRTWVKYIEKGTWPDTRRFFSVMRCNHCTDAPCVEICPTSALFIRKDGIVDFDTARCIGCKSCMQACPYDALYIDPDENTAQKCNYCVHRVEVGLEPACVVVCPEHAIIAGDLDNPESEIAPYRRQRAGVRPGTRAEHRAQPILQGCGAGQPRPADGYVVGRLYLARRPRPGSRMAVGGPQPSRSAPPAAAARRHRASRQSGPSRLQHRPSDAMGMAGVVVLPHQGDRRWAGHHRCPGPPGRGERGR